MNGLERARTAPSNGGNDGGLVIPSDVINLDGTRSLETLPRELAPRNCHLAAANDARDNKSNTETVVTRSFITCTLRQV
jgi:hypothetical protein